MLRVKRLLPALVVAALVIGSVGASAGSATAAAGPIASSHGFNVKAKSITSASSYWVVVDKLRPLNPKAYVPKDLVTVPVAHVFPAKLRKVASAAVVKMFAAFHTQTGKTMQSQSAYRSYSAQVRTYDYWVSAKGKKQADLQSARPGFSEHQTGLAIDISAKPLKCALAACFATTTQGKWLAKKAWKYGFILRYPKGKTAITGYEFEPWHYRYVGLALAKQMHVTKISTLEEFFGVKAAPKYK